MIIHIEFDIKITDQNGIVLQSTKNHYDGHVSSDGKQTSSTILDIKFADFLAEYLSSSGFFLREKLLKGCGSGKPKRHKSHKEIKEDTKISVFTDEGDLVDESVSDPLKGIDLEYKIRIGKNKVLIGKIPLKLDSDNNPELETKVRSVSYVADEPAIEVDTDYDEEASNFVSTDCDEATNNLVSSDCDEATNNLVFADCNEGSSSFVCTESDDETNPFVSSDCNEDIICAETAIRDTQPAPAICNFLKYSMVKAIEKYEDTIYNVWYEDTTNMETVIDK